MEWYAKNEMAKKMVAENTAAHHKKTAADHKKFEERGMQLRGKEAARAKASHAAWKMRNAAAEMAVKQHTAEAAKKAAEAFHY